MHPADSFVEPFDFQKIPEVANSLLTLESMRVTLVSRQGVLAYEIP
jgi:hypothetical protein